MTAGNRVDRDVPKVQLGDAHAGKVGLAIAGLLALILTAAGLVAALLQVLPRDLPEPPPNRLETQPTTPPGPQLQIQPRIDLQREQLRAETLLNGYGWADRDGRLARIPIGRAIEILADHGWPDAAPDGAKK